MHTSLAELQHMNSIVTHIGLC